MFIHKGFLGTLVLKLNILYKDWQNRYSCEISKFRSWLKLGYDRAFQNHVLIEEVQGWI